MVCLRRRHLSPAAGLAAVTNALSIAGPLFPPSERASAVHANLLGEVLFFTPIMEGFVFSVPASRLVAWAWCR